MNITLEHPAVRLVTPKAWQELLEVNQRTGDDIGLFGTLCGRIETITKKIKEAPSGNLYYDNPEVKKLAELHNKFKGDVFEVFVELLIKLAPNDGCIGIYDYYPVGCVGCCLHYYSTSTW